MLRCVKEDKFGEDDKGRELMKEEERRGEDRRSRYLYDARVLAGEAEYQDVLEEDKFDEIDGG